MLTPLQRRRDPFWQATTKSTNPDDYQQAPGLAAVMAKEYPDGTTVDTHRHPRAQLIYATHGVVEVTVDHALWLVPPQRALWMPPDLPHRMRARGKVSLRSAYVSPDACPAGFPDAPRAVNVSPLLRELIVRAASIPLGADLTERDGLVITHLLAEIEWAPGHPLQLPCGGDRRLARICNAILASPGDTRTLDEWVREVGASSRTLARLFVVETGMSFIQWRQLARIQHALPLLASGMSVARVSSELGYETASAFAAMFRRVTGTTPSAYFRLSGST
jgi:AraC-like DNA-binding protein/quercetin dioxygenase-like cupin family protein